MAETAWGLVAGVVVVVLLVVVVEIRVVELLVVGFGGFRLFELLLLRLLGRPCSHSTWFLAALVGGIQQPLPMDKEGRVGVLGGLLAMPF